MNFPDVIGIIGVISCLIAYAGLQLQRFQQDDLRYLGLNILSPACLLYSLVHNFNLAAVITQVLWICLTLVGLIKAMRARGRRTQLAARDCAENKT
ncbi:MAG TPA: hypothetical protein VJ673_02065 [Aromatoleum sp.]|uniref:CBU_0592 family membrane protein n=1 Tax=Aromatoleum sp. TaxID=2307007 RepID=UPI002B46708D|nr:hypothetical protein [Aromatoleum sp.]HJV24435.1 hypothetical protein [Aromatoleum sp.]